MEIQTYSYEPLQTDCSCISGDSIDQLLADTEELLTHDSAVFPDYLAEWCYKRGTKKSQQYWVYSEGAQFNYMKWNFQSGELNWNAHSRVMKRKCETDLQSSSLIFIEDLYAGPIVRGISLEACSAITFIDNFFLCDLEEVPLSEIEFEVQIVNDQTQPIHPGQVSAELINYKVNLAPSSFHYPTPFSFWCSIQFFNRVEGWFRTKGKLKINDIVFFESYSDVFMLNNPRMKKRREFQSIPPGQVKFMQVCGLIEEPAIDRAGVSLGYSPELISQLKQDSAKFFSSGIGKRSFTQHSFQVSLPQSKKSKTMNAQNKFSN
jgi:hypothetical protein